MFWLQKAWHSLPWWKQKDIALLQGFSSLPAEMQPLFLQVRGFSLMPFVILVWRGLAIRDSAGTVWPWFCYERPCRKTQTLTSLCSSACDHYSLNLSFPLLPFSGVSSIRNPMTLCKLSSSYNYWTCVSFAKWLKHCLVSGVSCCIWLAHRFAMHPHLGFIISSNY